MSAGNFTFFNTGKEALLARNANQVDWNNNTVVALLLNASYTPNLTHSTVADVTTYQVDDVGYTPSVLTNKVTTLTDATILYDADDISFGTNVTITNAKYVVLVHRAGASVQSTDTLLGYGDLNTDGSTATISSTNSEFKVGTANGIFDV